MVRALQRPLRENPASLNLLRTCGPAQVHFQTKNTNSYAIPR